MSIDDFLRGLVKKFPLEVNCQASFYDCVKKELNCYINSIKDIDSTELNEIITLEFRVKPTVVKFQNLLQNISKRSLEILLMAHQGDIYDALSKLKQLLFCNSSLQYKLKEQLINYISFTLPNGKFFRVVDVNISESIENCGHIPFDKRHRVKNNRFNATGYPCLYLSNSLNGCMQEVGVVEDGKDRYWSEFIFNSNSKLPAFFDLRIPKLDEISTLSVYDKFIFLLKYPLYVLCLTTTNRDFKEEYLFSQLLFHLLFMSKIMVGYNLIGNAYSSTKDTLTTNYVIPARMPSGKILVKGQSDYISKLFCEEFKGKMLNN